jgi:putative ABC transport system permease protein
MTGLGEPERLRGNYVTGDTFRVMGVPPLWGRALSPADTDPGAPLAAVLGYRFWQRRFGGESAVLGRQLRLNEKTYTVVGVMPKRFMWRGADVYLPVVYRRGEFTEGVRTVHVLGRLKPGVTAAQAEADLRPIVDDRRQDPAQIPENYRVSLLSFKETFPSGIRDQLWILFGAVGLLLLIACANVSNLLLSKAATRYHEMAVRSALGAGRWRLVRQLLSESLLLAAAGSLFGIGLAWAGIRAVLTLVPPFTIPDESEIVLNLPVLLFTVALCCGTSFLFGLAPALHSSSNLVRPFGASGRGSTGNRRLTSFRGGLVVGEVALSLILLVGSGLMIRTLGSLHSSTDPGGAPPERVLTLRVPLTQQRYPTVERRAAFMTQLLERIHSLPGVRQAAVNSGLHPFAGWGVAIEVPSSGRIADTRPVLLHQINPGYLSLAGIPLLAGRLFTDSEVASRYQLALVNQAFVTRYFLEGDPVGASVRIQSLRQPPFNLQNDSFQVIGITADAANRFSGETMPELYIPFTILAMPDRLAVYTAQDPAALTNAVRAQVYALDKDQPVTDVRTVRQFLHEFVYSTPRFNLFLLGVFAFLGLVLAVVGVYGVVSNQVAGQTREIGIRIAVGAGMGDILRAVLSRGFRLLVVGVAAGFAGSVALTYLIQRQLWQVSGFDPLSFSGAALLLIVAGILACWWPARRAARVDPVTALRYE